MPNPIPIACNLDRVELPERRAELAALGEAMTAVEAEGVHARLCFPADRRDALTRFVQAESSCCPFFEFDLTDENDSVALIVTAPDDAEWAVRGLVAGFVAGWEGLV
jgi:hypothetical protein